MTTIDQGSPKDRSRSEPPPATSGGRLARLVSVVTSPFLVTAVAVSWVVYLLHPDLHELLLWAGICVLSTAVIPFSFVYLLLRIGRVTDVHVALREQRALPFVVTIASASLGLYALHRVHAPPELVSLGAAFIVDGIALTVITLRWKISVHAATFAAAIVAVAAAGSPVYLAGFVLLPGVFWARLRRRRHTLFQGIVAACLIAALTYVVFRASMYLQGAG